MARTRQPGIPIYDTTFKEVVSHFQREHFEALQINCPGPLEPLDVDLSSIISVSADKLVKVVGPDEEIIHLEFQSSVDTEMPEKLLVYAVLAARRYRIERVRSILILLRPKADRADLNGQIVWDHSECPGYLQFSYRVIRLYEIPVDRLLEGPLECLSLCLLANVPDGEHLATLEKMRARLETETTPQKMAEVLGHAVCLLGLSEDESLIQTLCREIAGMIDLRDSKTVQDFINEGLARGRVEGLAEGRTEGLAEGRTEGLVEGRTEGQLSSLKTTLLDLGTTRFGAPEASARHAIDECLVADRLRGAVQAVLTATSWDELVSQLTKVE